MQFSEFVCFWRRKKKTKRLAIWDDFIRLNSISRWQSCTHANDFADKLIYTHANDFADKPIYTHADDFADKPIYTPGYGTSDVADKPVCWSVPVATSQSRTYQILVGFAATHAIASAHCLIRLSVQGQGQGHWTDRSALDPNDLWTGPALHLSARPTPGAWT